MNLICSNGKKKWYSKGKLHREDGPAIELPDGTKQWYLNGVKYDANEEYMNEVASTRNTSS